jgi:hypothetical protein
MKFNLKKALYDKCGCYDSRGDKYLRKFSPPCNFSQYRDCAYNEFIRFNSSKMNEQCFANCPLECDSVEFELTTSQSNWPSTFYGNLLIHDSRIHLSNYTRNFTSIDNIKRSSLAVNVYYNDISYTSIEEKPELNLSTMVANIASYMSMWCGVSLMSFVEIFELAGRVCINLIIPKIKKATRKKAATKKTAHINEQPPVIDKK